MSNTLRENILELRKQGKTYKEICDLLGCAKSTVSYHCNSKKKTKSFIRFEDRGISKSDVISCYVENGFRKTMDKYNLTSYMVSKLTKNVAYNKKQSKIFNKNLTLGELKLHCKSLKDSNFKVGIYIRKMCRTWLSFLKEEPCKNCGYEKHIELCHIKAIVDFKDDSLLGDINSEYNVVPLCPNCHWEFDNGLLKMRI